MIGRVTALILTTLAFCGGAITLTGWYAGIPRLTDWHNDGISMFPNTAFAVMMSSLAVFLAIVYRERRWARPAVASFAAVTLTIAGATLVEHILRINLGIDQMLVTVRWGERGATALGRMGIPATVTFLLLTGSILLMNTGRPLYRRSAAVLATLGAMPPVLAWTAYLYGADPLYSVPHLTGIARQTAVLQFMIAVSAILAVHDYGLGELLRRRDASGTLLRRLLPLSIGLLVVTGWLKELGQDHGLYDAAFGDAVLTVLRVFIFTAMLWWTARAVGLQIRRRMAVEVALNESRAQFRAMVDGIPQLAWVARPDGWMTWCNRQWVEYTGKPSEELEGWGWRNVHDPMVLPEAQARLAQALDSGTPFEMVLPLRAADGEYRPFLTRMMPVRDEGGRVVQWFGTSTDIAGQIEAEAALREANRIKDEFLATLSHELRTPMSAILGWSQILRRTNADDPASRPEELAQGLTVIERNARLQAQIIDDLLDMNRILSGKVRLTLQSVQIGEIIRAVVEAVGPAASAKNQLLEVSIGEAMGEVRGDSSRLQQVFYNLLQNAVKFTPRGGRIRIAAGATDSQVIVWVTDNGVGIKREFLPHVFERFRQQDASITRTHGGLGLGLGIVKHLVELHGGTVSAASDGENRGATFTVKLPVSRAAAHAQPEEPASDRPAAAAQNGNPHGPNAAHVRLAGFTALVVDDEADARHLLDHLLRLHGIRPILAPTAREAIDLLKQHKPDIVVSDIGMPGMDGFEMLRVVRRLPAEQGGRVPAIALTAFARSDDRTNALAAGYQLHLAKPVEVVELMRSIERLLVADRTPPSPAGTGSTTAS